MESESLSAPEEEDETDSMEEEADTDEENAIAKVQLLIPGLNFCTNRS